MQFDSRSSLVSSVRYRLKEHLSTLTDEQRESDKRYKDGRMRKGPKKQSKRAQRMGEECT